MRKGCALMGRTVAHHRRRHRCLADREPRHRILLTSRSKETEKDGVERKKKDQKREQATLLRSCLSFGASTHERVTLTLDSGSILQPIRTRLCLSSCLPQAAKQPLCQKQGLNLNSSGTRPFSSCARPTKLQSCFCSRSASRPPPSSDSLRSRAQRGCAMSLPVSSRCRLILPRPR